MGLKVEMTNERKYECTRWGFVPIPYVLDRKHSATDRLVQAQYR